MSLARNTRERKRRPKSPKPDPNLWFYRDRTLGMLRRYLRLSVEVGRLPSILGREFFRTGVTSYSVSTFEDVVIFVHDVERTLDRLYGFDKRLISLHIFQEYTRRETGVMMGCTMRTVHRRFFEAVDHISEMFLAGGLLEHLELEEDEPDSARDRAYRPIQTWKQACGKSCQAAESGRTGATV